MAFLHILVAIVLAAYQKEASGRGDIKIITRTLNPNVLTSIDSLASRSSGQAELENDSFPSHMPIPRMLHPKLLSKSKLKQNPDVPYCQKNDTLVQNACFEFCTRLRSYGNGACSPDQSHCVCSTEGQGQEPIKVKLFRPEAPQKRNQEPFQYKKTQKQYISVVAVGKFDCNHSKMANSICRVFCDLRGAFLSNCSEDQSSCLCLDFRKSREQRDLLDAVEVATVITPAPVLPAITVPDTRSSLERSQARLPFPLENRQISFIQSPLTCTPYSCLNNCPRYCDSLCTSNMQCFCSCPEDHLPYNDYFDPAPSPMFQLPFWNY